MFRRFAVDNMNIIAFRRFHTRMFNSLQYLIDQQSIRRVDRMKYDIVRFGRVLWIKHFNIRRSDSDLLPAMIDSTYEWTARCTL